MSGRKPMAGKKSAKTSLKENTSLKVAAQKFYGYAEYHSGMPLFISLTLSYSGTDSAEDIDVTAESESGLLLPFARHFGEVPSDSVLEIGTENIVSPVYLTEIEKPEEVTLTVRVLHEKDILAEERCAVTVLPYDYWCGREGMPEMLACFVRPKIADCVRMKEEARAQLARWKVSCEWQGYREGDRNRIRYIIAAFFSALRRQAVGLSAAEFDCSCPVPVGDITKILKEKVCSPFEMALLFASCLESAGLNPVLAVGQEHIACGVWLYDNCFTESSDDDIALLQKYVSGGVNAISMIDCDELFEGRNVNYVTAESHFVQRLQSGWFDCVVDIRRCRYIRIPSLPLKVKGLKGYEFLSGRDTDLEAAPDILQDGQKVSLDGKVTRDKQWERRLLDLSLKNTLLNFHPEKNVLHIMTADMPEMFGAFAEGGAFEILEKPSDPRMSAVSVGYFSAQPVFSAWKELIRVELKNRRIRTCSDKNSTGEVLRYLVRKAKTAEEEAGANVLFLAFGFLKWCDRGSGDSMYAPLILCPVAITKSRGGRGYSVSFTGEELRFNTTLLEYLYREFRIDLRGLEGAPGGLKIPEILSLVRTEILNMPRWEVLEEVYLANFSFARFAMWNDVRSNMDTFRNNALIRSLLTGRLCMENRVFSEKDEDSYPPDEVLCPLPADESQFAAVAEAAAGTTFVLHGPPGTGKSQTITNIIANCLSRGMRVLFVAEKQAALSVVKKRLDSVGLGDFCLELHSGKTDKAELLRSMESTLALAGPARETAFAEKSRQLTEIRAELNAPVAALHRKRRLGVSVYEGILIWQKNKDAPDVLDIESSFYDQLTKEKLNDYETMLSETAAAAKQCGGAYGSPFEHVSLTEFSAECREKVYVSAEVMLVETRHFKNYLGLFLSYYKQKVSTFTARKFNALRELALLLSDGTADKYYRCDPASFQVFFNAGRRLDRLMDAYSAKFRELVDVSGDPSLLEQEVDNWGTNFKSSRMLNAYVKKLSRVSKEKLSPEETVRYVEMLARIYGEIRLLKENTDLAANFTDRNGRLNFRKRDDFMADMRRIQALAESVFMDYNADSFNSVCAQSSGGLAAPLLSGYLRSAKSFADSRTAFCDTIGADSALFEDEDQPEFYSRKAAALIDNIDMLSAWCMYRKRAAQLDSEGLSFITLSLESGKITSDNLLSSFRKNVYRNFVETNISADPELAKFSAGVLEDRIERFRAMDEDFSAASREHIRMGLIANIPTASTEGPLSLEVAAFSRIAKSNMRGMRVKDFFAEIPGLLSRIAPCMLMSPATVAQHLAPDPELFDIVIFDEASQLPTCEAVGSLARAKSAVIVGDPKQLPPTSFFSSGYVDEENLETEDLDSILDDCLALGVPEKHLTWHYRSKHESLIAFSNVMYYDNMLRTFPSPDALESKVRLCYVENGVYDRGFTKRNKEEAEALVRDVVRRLSDPVLSRSSIGIVTFSTAQQDYIERRLADALVRNGLEDKAYDRDEPLFVKNLENVQGDERDVILFSVCYGPDRAGRVSLNFGPLNQTGGWRRLNVAVSRAREEMCVFSSMTSAMINLAKTNSKGVAGLKAFLEFAEKGKTNLAIRSESLKVGGGIGKYIARELAGYGYDCRYDLGFTDFKIDCAVLDPRGSGKFLLAVMCDGETAAASSAKDRNVIQIRALKQNNWNVIRVFTISFISNPKREVKRIKDVLDRLCGLDRSGKDSLAKYRRNYRYAKTEQMQYSAQYVSGGENREEILSRIRAVVAAEEPISERYLIRRVLSTLGIRKWGGKTEEELRSLIALCGFKSEKLCGETYFRKTDRCLSCDTFRVEEVPLRHSEEDFTPYEIIACARGILENRVSLYLDELAAQVLSEMRVQRPGDRLVRFTEECILLGAERSLFVRSVSDRISL